MKFSRNELRKLIMETFLNEEDSVNITPEWTSSTEGLMNIFGQAESILSKKEKEDSDNKKRFNKNKNLQIKELDVDTVSRVLKKHFVSFIQDDPKFDNMIVYFKSPRNLDSQEIKFTKNGYPVIAKYWKKYGKKIFNK